MIYKVMNVTISIALFVTSVENDKAETVYYDCPVIIGYTWSLLSHSAKCRRGWSLNGGNRDWVSVLKMYNNSEI